MVTVIHYDTNKDPDVYTGMDDKTEIRTLTALIKKGWIVERASPDEWYGQDIPGYGVHHWNAKRIRKN